jgi:15-cis-phytoene synthase
MNSVDEDLPPPIRLAVAYVPKEAKAAFSLLLRFDARFAGIIGHATEPLIAQMKLAWWRDSIKAAGGDRPKGEPLLSMLFALDSPVLHDAVVQLADAWETLIGDDDWSGDTLQAFARQRGQAVFQGYTMLLMSPAISQVVAEEWAASDLRMGFGERVGLPSRPDPAGLPKGRAFRPLTILAMSVRGVSGPRLIWHALTGR